jgi:predicted nucleic acid-binding protein
MAPYQGRGLAHASQIEMTVSDPVRAILDTNIPVRHLTGDPPSQARRATAFLGAGHELFLTDLVLAELVYVLEAVYRRPRRQIAEAARSLLALRGIVVVDPDLLLRAIELYESATLHFAEAYLAAAAESWGVGAVASFDRGLHRVTSIRRLEP